MSKPNSRLAAFRSYSYYHVLAMCDSTETAHALAESTLVGAWDHATSETAAIDDRPSSKELGKYSPKCVGYQEGAGGKTSCLGRYVVMINGSQDAAFAITKATWSSVIAAGAVPHDGNTSLAVEGSIAISEPKGVAFLDQVVKCSVALGVDSSQIVYCLKTFFVGFEHSADHKEIPTVISDVAPVVFTVYDVQGSFTQDGGTYEMSFVAQANGVARLPQYSKAVNAMSLTAGANLKDTMQKLQDNIKKSYDNYYNCVVASLKQANTEESKSLLESLCKVDYIIHVDKPYNTNFYKVTNSPIQAKNGSKCDSESTFTFPKNTSIETAINLIMQSSQQVQDEMSNGDGSNKIKYEYKIHSCVKSERIRGSGVDSGKMKYTVVYNIVRFLSPKAAAMSADFEAFARDNITQDPDYQRLSKNIIEFDYIYTGKNIDIIEFDMKVNLGLGYLQIATLANTYKEQRERAAGVRTSIDQSGVNVAARGGNFSSGPIQVPVFFGKQITHPKFINSQDGNSAIQSGFTLAKHASLEMSEAVVRIVGNDLLLLATNKNTSPEYMLRQFNKPADLDAKPTPDQSNFPDWMYVPSYAKINVKMPRNNDDFALFTGQADSNSSSTDYAQDFWFDGYYFVYSIEHMFDNGEFTQTLQMLGIPKTSALDATKVPPKEINFDTQIGECFDNKMGCGKSPASTSQATPGHPVAVPPQDNPAKPGTPSLSDNDNKTVVTSAQRGDLSRIRGWYERDPTTGAEATEEVRTAIIDAAAYFKVDPVTMAQIAFQESKFNPRAGENRTENKAQGLYQFIGDTWNVNLGRDEVLTPSVYADKTTRLNARLSAHAGAAYAADNRAKLIEFGIPNPTPDDLYLAHFMGLRRAKFIIKYDHDTNGTATLAQALGEPGARSVVSENAPYIYGTNMTVREVRQWVTETMAKTFKGSNIALVKRKAPAPTNTVSAPPNEKPKVATPKASDKVAAQQDCKAQDAKKDEPTCNKTAQTEKPPVQLKCPPGSHKNNYGTICFKNGPGENDDGTCKPGYHPNVTGNGCIKD